MACQSCEERDQAIAQVKAIADAARAVEARMTRLFTGPCQWPEAIALRAALAELEGGAPE